jgi:Zn-dependent protease/predicted transcriptional regulator
MHGFRLGRLFGIELRVDWSWVFIFVLLTWNLASVFQQWHPDWPASEELGVAVISSLLFFGCILAHELAHSVVATRLGLRVRSITLFLFGGVSNIEHEPASPKAELLTAIVGPLTSILLGIGFLALAGLAARGSMTDAQDIGTWAARLGPLSTLLVWLGPINVAIGLFNLVPAFPLDGGRILRAILWATTGRLRTATVGSSAVGQSIGWAFILCGIAMSFGLHVPYFGTGLVAGLWLTFIGWFVRNGAAVSVQRLAVDDALAGHTVDEVMRMNGPIVTPEVPLQTLVHDYLVRSDERALPVVRNGQLVGLVSAYDMRWVPPGDWPTTPVSAVMIPTVALSVAFPREPLAKAFAELAQRDIGQLPVLDHGRLVGMLKRGDIARWLELSWRPMAGHFAGHPTPRRS